MNTSGLEQLHAGRLKREEGNCLERLLRIMRPIPSAILERIYRQPADDWDKVEAEATAIDRRALASARWRSCQRGTFTPFIYALIITWAGLIARYLLLCAVISKACGTDSRPVK